MNVILVIIAVLTLLSGGLLVALGDLAKLRTAYVDALDATARQMAQMARMRKAWIANEDEIQQVLAEVLGYPRGPGPDGNPDPAAPFCAGDHVAVTLAMEAADELRRLRAGLKIG